MNVQGLTIKEIQAHLNAYGDFDLVLDGIAGSQTVAAATVYVETSDYPRKPSWDRDKKATLLSVEQVLLKHFGFYHGDIDGYTGQLTDDARLKYAAGNWRDSIDGLLPPVLPGTMAWPKYVNYDQMCGAFGEPGERLIRLDLPYPMLLAWDKSVTISHIAIHELVADSAYKALNEIKDEYSEGARINLGLNLYGGCYNNRPMRGSSKKSTHAWGIAIDFDPERNQLRWDHKKAKLASFECESFWRAWEKQGWVSLGRERDYDWMHVQACNI